MTYETRQIYSVSQLNAATRMLLEDSYGLVWISGEISNLSRPASGHIYFTLKDAAAQIRCAMFRNKNSAINFQLKDGLHVNVEAQVSIYEARGDYQLIIQTMENAGDGILHEKFLKLKEKLANEGLFAKEHKKTLPTIPQCIGIITSPTGAAIRDILSVLKRRFCNIPVIIYPTQVQGNEAAAQIANAIKTANIRNECDCLILSRGGGSLEDLWPFNEEIVARAIFESAIPIISGIGHEIDFTIADFVADQRAPTPSAAAELIVPDTKKLHDSLLHLQQRLINLFQHKLHATKLLLENLQQRLKHPKYILQQQAQHLDYLTERLKLLMQTKLQNAKQNFANLCQLLETVSPLATLNRGYAIISKNNKIIAQIKNVQVGDLINAKIADGDLECEVTNISNTN